MRAGFIEYELPDDFVAHLRADRKAIADAKRSTRSQSGPCADHGYSGYRLKHLRKAIGR